MSLYPFLNISCWPSEDIGLRQPTRLVDGRRANDRVVRLWSFFRLRECHVEINKKKGGKKEQSGAKWKKKKQRREAKMRDKKRNKKGEKKAYYMSLRHCHYDEDARSEATRERRRQTSKAFIISGSTFLRNRAPQSLFFIEVSSFFVLVFILLFLSFSLSLCLLPVVAFLRPVENTHARSRNHN